MCMRFTFEEWLKMHSAKEHGTEAKPTAIGNQYDVTRQNEPYQQFEQHAASETD